MKKLLLILLGLLITTNAYAGLITISELSEDAAIDDLNKAFSTIKNEFNGNIEGVNILADSILETNLSDEINPAVREGDHFNAYTVSGHLPATSANLISDISAGTSYIKSDAGKLFRQVTNATSKTYTATKDTWVFIDINGTFQFTELAVGSAEPTAPSDSLKLAKVVTDSDNITSVSDERTLTVTLKTAEDFYLKGMIIHCDNTKGEISSDSGIVRHGSTLLGKSAFTNLTVATATDWHDGVVDTGSAVFYYIGINPSGDIKFLGNNPPNIHDTDENTDGILYYWDDGTTHWRVLGQIKVDASNNTLVHFQQGNKVRWDVPVSIASGGGSLSDNAWSSATSCSSAIPTTSELGVFGLAAVDAGSSPAGVWIRPNNTTWSTNTQNGVYSNATDAGPTGQRDCMTDGSQQIQYFNNTGDSDFAIDVESYIVNLRD